MVSINLAETKDSVVLSFSGESQSIVETTVYKSDINKLTVFSNNQGIGIYTRDGKKHTFLPNEIHTVNGKVTKTYDSNSTIETSEDIIKELRVMIGGAYTSVTGNTYILTNLNNTQNQEVFDESLAYKKLSVSTSSNGKGVIRMIITLADGAIINQACFSNDAYNIDLPLDAAPITSVTISEISGNSTDVIYNIVSK